MTSEETLFQKLGRELVQTEASTVAHSQREAQRLPGTPVAEALMRIAAHAKESLENLPSQFREQGRLLLGRYAGNLFFAARQVVVDRLVDREKSYRGTLLGMHQGIDLMRLMLPLAIEQEQAGLEAWCGRWLQVREELVEQAAAQLDWFAMHPREAGEPGWRPLAITAD